MPKKQKKSSKKQLKIRKVLFIVDAWFPFVGGGQIYARELKRVFESTYEIEVVIAAPPHHHLFLRAIWSLVAPWWLVVKYLFSKPDIIHSQGYSSGFVGKVISLILGIPIVHTVHGANLLDLDTIHLKQKLERWLLTQIRYDRQISVTTSFLEYQNVNTPHFIGNGVDLDSFISNDTFESTVPRILWIGRDDPVKGYDLFLEAFDVIVANNDMVRADIVLGGSMTTQELSKKYHMASIVAITSRSEGLPLVLLEAWAAKKPVISFAVGEIPRLIKESNGGIIVEPENTHAFAALTLELLADPQKITRLGESGYAYVKKYHSWYYVAKETLKVYETCV